MSITYIESIEGLKESSFAEGFFDGWPNPPSVTTLIRILGNSSHIVLAVDENKGLIVGYINALADGVLTAYIPLLEVVPDYKAQGIGDSLVRRMLERLKDYYMIDLLCDPELQGYYERHGMIRTSGMLKRNYAMQAGIPW
ncbi:GNAT family N-acetyltransferase [Paenibacillus sp. JX-17]|uniref:GNAT family N-acetyltransferase n=1 Tax=Paenibacillus lacisoli TaxID=3064525 RepID=A0ABT9CC66_9BACL|nr:GNAT family N-acetyltransferase [Paenibacillus sp. JX-17]MDO7906841.1 GNAT family N-acetyltransferase [Paenibacillus sp. JX-17]